MTLGGATDFLRQTADPFQVLTQVDVNTAGTQVVDLTALIQPNHQALLFYWVASLASVGQGVQFTVGASLNSVTLVPVTNLADGAYGEFPFAGYYITGNVGNTCTLQITRIPGDPNPFSGKLVILGQVANPFSVAAPRRTDWGFPGATGSKTVLAAAQTQVLAAPAAGFFYILRALSVRNVAAPAAVQSVSWALGATASYFVQHEFQVVAGMTFNVTLEMPCDTSVEVLNNLSVSVLCAIAYETRPI
jgi:hypothetical protein